MIPIVPIEPLMLPRLGPHHDDLWTTLCDFGDAHHEDWVIIGGQMVMLHALQAGRDPGRVSQDLDTVIDARVRPPALPAFVATLANLGFKSAGVSPDEIAHRFERGSIHVDVLGPDGLGGRADLRTTGTATRPGDYSTIPNWATPRSDFSWLRLTAHPHSGGTFVNRRSWAMTP